MIGKSSASASAYLPTQIGNLNFFRFRGVLKTGAACIFAVVLLLPSFATAQQGAPNAAVLATIPVGQAPVQLVVNQSTNQVYVANFLSSNVTVIDGVTNSTATVTDPNANGPYDVAVNEQTNKVYVPNFNSSNVTVINGANQTTTTVTDPNARNPAFAAVNAQTNKIYVTNWGSANVTVIDGATNTTTTVSAGSEPLYVAVNQVTNMIYVANQGGNVTVIDGATNVSTTITDPNASGPTSYLAVNPQTNKIYAANWASSNVSVIDGVTNAITTVTDPNAVHASVVAIDQQTNTIYVTNGGSGPYAGSNNVTVINGATNTTTTVTAPNTRGPNWVAVDPGLNLIYVPNWWTNNVTVIQGAGNSTVNLNGANAVEPNAVAVNSTTHRVYIANGGGFPFTGSNDVTVIGPGSSSKCSTSTALSSSLNPSIYGQKVTFIATVMNSGCPTPTGRVAFTWGSGTYTIGSAVLNSSGVAALTVAGLNADNYDLAAVYRGDANNLGSTSRVVNQVVEQTTSAATLTSSPNPSAVGQEVMFSAKIKSPTVTAKGPVTFSVGKTVLGTVELSDGKATFSTSSLPSGSNTVTVTYLGDSDIEGASASVTQSVGQTASTTTALTYLVNNSTLKETFTAKVTSTSAIPTGTVSFTVGKTTLGSAPLAGGKAILTVPTLAVGSNTVTANYAGNAEFGPSSAWITQTFVMPYNATVYLQQQGGSASAVTTFGVGTTPSNFVPEYTDLPNTPNPTGQVALGTFVAGTLLNFGMYSTLGAQNGWAFSTGTDQASLVSFADLSNSLGLNHGITQRTSSTTWVLHLDDALSYLYDDDNNDVIMEIILVPQ